MEYGLTHRDFKHISDFENVEAITRVKLYRYFLYVSYSVPSTAINSSLLRFYGCTINYGTTTVTP